jgi:hypothetical protein
MAWPSPRPTDTEAGDLAVGLKRALLEARGRLYRTWPLTVFGQGPRCKHALRLTLIYGADVVAENCRSTQHCDRATDDNELCLSGAAIATLLAPAWPCRVDAERWPKNGEPPCLHECLCQALLRLWRQDEMAERQPLIEAHREAWFGLQEQQRLMCEMRLRSLLSGPSPSSAAASASSSASSAAAAASADSRARWLLRHLDESSIYVALGLQCTVGTVFTLPPPLE